LHLFWGPEGDTRTDIREAQGMVEWGDGSQ